jgi:hypothetical protein
MAHMTASQNRSYRGLRGWVDTVDRLDIDFVQKAWASKRDPLYLPGNFNNRILVDACIPYDMKLKGTFPQVVDVSADLRARLRAKFPALFH